MAHPKESIQRATTYEQIVLFYENLRISEEEKTHHQIIRLYDLARNMVDAVEREGIVNAGQQLHIAEPAINQIIETADALSALFIKYLENGGKENPPLSREIDSAIRRFFAAMDTLNMEMQALADKNT